LVVTDNGIGWQGRYGNGLTGMRERLSVHGGKLNLQTTNLGTKLTATVEQLIEGSVHETD
jgi:signal transduction histidine kinase